MYSPILNNPYQYLFKFEIVKVLVGDYDLDDARLSQEVISPNKWRNGLQAAHKPIWWLSPTFAESVPLGKYWVMALKARALEKLSLVINYEIVSLILYRK